VAYTKTTWINDSPPDINAENLNKMEQGIADAQFPEGGTTGQVLKKTATGTEWGDESGGGTASDITYDNTDSGLTATDVQDAIDETVSALNTGLSSAVKSVNDITPDSNGNVEVSASDIPANGMGERTTSGNPIEIEDGVAGNALDLSVELEPIQSGSGDPSPTNIRPITGRTQVNVTRTGKNLYIGSPSFDGYTNSGWTKSEETYNNHEVYYCTQAWSRLYKEISVIAGKTYTFSAMVKANVDVPVYIYPQIVRTDAQFDKDFVKCFANQTWSRISGTFTAVTSGIAKIRAELSSEATLYVSEYQLEEGSTATSYEPYTGQTVTVALGQTVYGGTLDVTTGELVVDRAIVEYDGSSDELWGVYSPFSGFYINNPLMVRSYRSSGLSNWLKVFKRGDDPARGIWNGVDDNMHYILYVFELCGASSADSASEILAKWKTYLASNPLQITFLLATPQTIQLTAQQLALLEGYNILTTDGDTINLRYIGTEASDVQAEIDEFENVTYKLTTSIAPIEQTTAIATHAVGDYIMLNGEFCKVISAIAVGETITIGTNVSRTTIADELKAIIAQLGA